MYFTIRRFWESWERCSAKKSHHTDEQFHDADYGGVSNETFLRGEPSSAWFLSECFMAAKILSAENDGERVAAWQCALYCETTT